MRRLVILVIMLTLPAAAMIVMAGSVPTQISYQGRLTDSHGTPLTGSYGLVFRIYNTAVGGAALWTETQTVEAADGLFTVKLGAVSPIDPATMFNPADPAENGLRFLEVRITGQLLPMTPRTQLLSSPYSLVAGSIASSGANLTDNTLNLKDLDAGNQAQFSPDQILLGRDMPTNTFLKEPNTFFTMARMSTCSLSFSDTTGETLAVVDGSSGRLRLGSRSRAAIELYDQVPSSNLKLAELIATGEAGPALNFFDLGGQIMGVEPSPFGGGMSLIFFDPQPEPPGKMFEINASYGGGGAIAGRQATLNKSTSLNMYLPSTGGISQELVNLYINGPDGGSTAEMRLGHGAPLGNVQSLVSAKSVDSGSMILIAGPMGPINAPPILLTSSLSGAKIGIGTATPTQALYVVGNICYTGTIGACSDEKFKKDIEPISDALDAVDHLNGVRYSWRTDEFPDRQFSSDRQVGITAQEVQSVLPEAVIPESDGYLAVDYSRLTPLLLEAIKELKRQNADLEKRLEALEQDKK